MAGSSLTLAWAASFEAGVKTITTLGTGSTDADCTLVNDNTKARSGNCYLQFANSGNVSFRRVTVTGREHLIAIASYYFEGGLPGVSQTVPLLDITSCGPQWQLRTANGNWWWAVGNVNPSIFRARLYRDAGSLTVPVYDSGDVRYDFDSALIVDTGVAVTSGEWWTLVSEYWSVDASNKPTSVDFGYIAYVTSDATKKLRVDDVSIWQNNPNVHPNPPAWTIVRPDAVGSIDNWTGDQGGDPGSGNKWEDVDDIVPDDATTYIRHNGTSVGQRFTCGASGLSAGTNILGVSFWARGYVVSGSGFTALLVWSTGSNSAIKAGATWTTINAVRSARSDNTPITLTEIDSNLELGVLTSPPTAGECRLSHLVLEILSGPQPTDNKPRTQIMVV